MPKAGEILFCFQLVKTRLPALWAKRGAAPENGRLRATDRAR